MEYDMQNRKLPEDVVIIGAGGFGREVKWLIERINGEQPDHLKWKIKGFIDDGMALGTRVADLPVLGGLEWFEQVEKPVCAVCAIGSAETRKKVIGIIRKTEKVFFPNFIDPAAVLSEKLKMGCGNIICASSIITVDIKIKDFLILNLDCTVGHDTIIDSFVTVYPGVHLSGNVHVGERTEIGTGSQIIQGINIGAGTVIGAGGVVIRDLPGNCTAVGNPAKVIKNRELI